MKIALINPPSPFLIDEKVFPNLGLVSVATSLKKKGIDVNIIDLAGNKDYLKTVDNLANEYKTFGISSTTPQFKYTYQIAKRINSNDKFSRIYLGGAHASAMLQLKKKHIDDNNLLILDFFDGVFGGEGENVSLFPTQYVMKVINDIDELPIPDRSLIDIKSYKFKLNGKPTTSIITQRGCAYQCDFCCGRDIPMYNKVRTHSTKRVLEEMDYLNNKFGYESFMWFDDEINLKTDRLKNLCDALENRPYQHRGFVRNDLIVQHPEIVKYLKKAGFVKLCSGVESGSDRTLKLINKGTTSDINTKARKIIGDEGIHYEAFTLIGHPSETRYNIAKTINWILENKPDDFDINIITPYPGSKIYDNSVPSTEFKDYAWEYKGLYFNKPNYSKEDSYYKGIDRQSHSNVRTKTLTNDDLTKIRNEMEELK